MAALLFVGAGLGFFSAIALIGFADD